MVNGCCICKKKYIKIEAVSLHRFPKDENRRKLWESKIGNKGFRISNSSRICSKHFTSDSFEMSHTLGYGTRTWLKIDAVPTIFDFSNNSSSKSQELQEKRELTTVQNGDVVQRNIASQPFMERFSYIDNSKENHVTSPLIINVYSERSQKSQNESDIKIDDIVEIESEEAVDSDSDFSTRNEKKLKLIKAKSYRYLGDFVEEDMYSPKKALAYFKLSSKYRKKKQAQVKALQRDNSYLKKRNAVLKQKLSDINRKFSASRGVQLTSLTPTESSVEKGSPEKQNAPQKLI